MREREFEVGDVVKLKESFSASFPVVASRFNGCLLLKRGFRGHIPVWHVWAVGDNRRMWFEEQNLELVAALRPCKDSAPEV